MKPLVEVKAAPRRGEGGVVGVVGRVPRQHLCLKGASACRGERCCCRGLSARLFLTSFLPSKLTRCAALSPPIPACPRLSQPVAACRSLCRPVPSLRGCQVGLWPRSPYRPWACAARALESALVLAPLLDRARLAYVHPGRLREQSPEPWARTPYAYAGVFPFREHARLRCCSLVNPQLLAARTS
jgi:hypothetical protein